MIKFVTVNIEDRVEIKTVKNSLATKFKHNKDCCNITHQKNSLPYQSFKGKCSYVHELLNKCKLIIVLLHT
jgi:hypothetical protein